MDIWLYIWLYVRCSDSELQSIVELPKLHKIGRSRFTETDQLLYVAGRLEELETLKTVIHFNGRVYKDYLKFFTGKTCTSGWNSKS